MTGFLVPRSFLARFGEGLAAAARAAEVEPQFVHLPGDPAARLTPEDCAKIEVAYLSREWSAPRHLGAFGETVASAPNLKWVHCSSTGLDQYGFLRPLAARGVALTSSIGATGEAVAQTAICGMLMLGRHFPSWWAAQGRHAWEPMRGDAAPRDLRGQTALVIGLGVIGAAVARFCRALGMRVIGARRSARQPDDPVDEMITIADLPAVLPRCDRVVLACTYTPETHHLLDAQRLGMLPRGAHVINTARGALVDEPALVAALRSGQVGGAYLDVFEEEPLSADSPLWDMPNVIVSPHNASAASGNDARAAAIFFANLVRFGRGEPLGTAGGAE